jgi:hypothetical protein
VNLKKNISDRDDDLDSLSVDGFNELLANTAGQFEPLDCKTNKKYTGKSLN